MCKKDLVMRNRSVSGFKTKIFEIGKIYEILWIDNLLKLKTNTDYKCLPENFKSITVGYDSKPFSYIFFDYTQNRTQLLAEVDANQHYIRYQIKHQPKFSNYFYSTKELRLKKLTEINESR